MERKEKNKWDWATPEKLGPDREKHALQGALILLVTGLLLTALGIFLAVKFKTLSFTEFTGLENTYRNWELYFPVMLIFNAPLIIGVFLTAGALRCIVKEHFPHLF